MDINYVLRCESCGFHRVSDGSQEATADLREVILCPKCNGPKTFKCPGCGYVVKAKRWAEPPDPAKHFFKRD
jgi:hypothetical protein